MIAPAAMMVEIARDRLIDSSYMDKHRSILEAQMKEVQCAIPGQAGEFYFGYQLGVEAARVLLEGMPQAVFNKVSI
jgi:hypothetical protein